MSAADAASGSSSFHGGGNSRGNGGGASANGGVSGGAGGHNGAGTGLVTGRTMYGNAAYGAPGGLAQGYATSINGGFGNFRNLDGSAAFSGPYQSGYGYNAGAVADQLRAQNAAWAAAQPRQGQPQTRPVSAPPTSPLQTAVPPVTTAPPATVPQTALPTGTMIPAVIHPLDPYGALRAYQSSYGPEYMARAGDGLKGWVRNTNAINNVTGIDPGYRVDSNAMLKTGWR